MRPRVSARRVLKASDRRSINGSVSKLRSRMTYANAISTVALFLALGDGAYAVSVPRNSVGSAQLKKAR